MTEGNRGAADRDAVREDRDRVREELRDTVDALAGKLDVRARATGTAQAAAETVSRKTGEVEQKVHGRVEQAQDHAHQAIERVRAEAPGRMADRGRDVVEYVRRNPVPAVSAAAVAAVAAWLLVRRSSV
ncbi:MULTISPECIES: DUF3618 domain-containing protein [Nocardia]|uniref:DUF3618 domain-containing protein n=1 Tax=Nocardia TaxID=1817 RepID=UPI001895D624|nr:MULTISPECIES: DUF3618 domain-containing protein [Nocardia]MBF6347401.1 DUF3618 domain-containing protein [Nocardia flavorosea]